MHFCITENDKENISIDNGTPVFTIVILYFLSKFNLRSVAVEWNCRISSFLCMLNAALCEFQMKFLVFS